MNEECPNCKQSANTSCSRLIKDSCGHIKCRMCLLYEEQGCKICNNEHRIQNIGNYDCPPATKDISNDICVSENSTTCNEEVILPLELVIDKDWKCKANNAELVPIDYMTHSELYYADTFHKNKETCMNSTTIVQNDNIPNNSYIPKVETTSASFNVNNNIVVETLSFNKTAHTNNFEAKIELPSEEKIPPKKSIKWFNRTHISVIPGTPERYKCNICSKIFRNKKGKCYHDACITGIRPYQCTFCDRSFVKRSHFEYHERVHKGYKPFKCNVCDKAFPQRNKLNRHMYSHSEEKQFACSKCNKRYTKRDDLKNHLDMHSGTATYSCKVCDKVFRIRTNLKRHLKTHTNERPHACDQCNKSFKDKSLLIRHKRTHGKDRPFSCAHCSRVFLSKSELGRHLTVHSDEKPFSCEFCQTVFRRKDNLHRHIRHHHPDNRACNVGKLENTVPNTTSKLVKTKLIHSKQKQKSKKVQKITSSSLSKSPAKVSVVCVNSRDQISSRLDSMGNITPVIRTTNEVSNAVPVINGPINVRAPEDKTDTRKKTFTYIEPIPLAEAVVINKQIEEKLYTQNVSNHNYFFRNCPNSIDKSCPTSLNQSSRTNYNIKSSAQKATICDNSLSETVSSVQISFACQKVELPNFGKDINSEKQMHKKKDIKVNTERDSKHLINNFNEKCNTLKTMTNISNSIGLKQDIQFVKDKNYEQKNHALVIEKNVISELEPGITKNSYFKSKESERSNNISLLKKSNDLTEKKQSDVHWRRRTAESLKSHNQ